MSRHDNVVDYAIEQGLSNRQAKKALRLTHRHRPQMGEQMQSQQQMMGTAPAGAPQMGATGEANGTAPAHPPAA